MSEFGKKNGLFENRWAPLWVVDFPMFEYDEENQRWTLPCTTRSPAPRMVTKTWMVTAPEQVHLPRATTWCSTAGKWVAAPSVSTAPTCSSKVFDRPQHHARRSPGSSSAYLLDALQYGAPPHGGLAFGLDRIDDADDRC